MILHIVLLLLIIIVSCFCEKQYRENRVQVVSNEGFSSISGKRLSIIPWIIVFGYIVYLASMRDYINDTGVYAGYFYHAEGSWEEISNIISGDQKDKGFYILQSIFKMFISKDYHVWFFFIACVESLFIIFALKDDTISFFDTLFFFFASTLYINYFTMMRQWLAISIVFFAVIKLLRKKRLVIYVFLCLLAVQFHVSAIIAFLFIFLIRGEPWKAKQIIFIFIFVASLLIIQPILSFVDSSDGLATYDYVIKKMQSNTGASLIRIPIAAVPVIISYIERERIKENAKNALLIYMCINISLLNLLLTVLATVTSGLFVIRLSVYANVFNLILFPYLLNISITENNRKIVKTLFYVLYLIFYFVQMFYQDAFMYSSTIIGDFK